MTVWHKAFSKYSEDQIISEFDKGLITNQLNNDPLNAWDMSYWAVCYNKPKVLAHCLAKSPQGSINRVFDYYSDQGLTLMHVAIKNDAHDAAKKLMDLGFTKFNYNKGDLYRTGPLYSCRNTLYKDATLKADEKGINEDLRLRRIGLLNLLIAAGANDS
jgi:hypothetical protein